MQPPPPRRRLILLGILAVALLSGGTIGYVIWDRTRLPLTPEVNAMSTILLGISIVFVTVSFLIARRRRA